MKRLFAMLAAFMLFACGALAEISEFKMGGEESLIICQCVQFEGEMPEEIEEIFAARLLEDDAILCGVKMDTYYTSRPDELKGSEALLAVKRGDKVLLMGAKLEDGAWHAYIETDEFFTADTPFSVGVEGEYNSIMDLSAAWLAIYVGDGMYYVHPGKSGVELDYYVKRFAGSGDERVIAVDTGRGLRCEMRKAGELDDVLYVGSGAVPTRLGAWTHDTFPKDETEAEYYHLSHAFVLKEDEAFISGVNLRDRPTGSSDSWGQYTARVKVLGSEPGLQAPWYNVQVGNLTGWVSGAYLIREGDDDVRYYSAAAMALPVAKAKESIILRDRPGEAEGQRAAGGALMHVLEENDGWLHVILPRYGLDWQVDWYGTYGFVRADEVIVGVSSADVREP